MIWVCPELLDLSPRPRPRFSQTKTGDNFNPPFFQISHPFRLETSGYGSRLGTQKLPSGKR